MFGFNAWAAKQHLVSHLIVSVGSWLLEPGNPVMAYVPVVTQPELIQEIKNEVAARQKVLSEAGQAAPAKTGT